MIEMVGIGPFVVIPLVIKAMGGPQCLLPGLRAQYLLARRLCLVRTGRGHAAGRGSYVFLREAYGPGRLGRLMSFLFVWQTLIQAPLSLASGAIGFSQYASYLYPLGKYGQKAVSGALVILLVILLYRRIASIGKISLFLWSRCGYDPVAHLGRRHAFPAAPRFHLCAGILGFFLAVFCYPRLRHRQHHLHLLGLLQHLPPRRRNPRSARNIPRGIFISIIGIAILYLAMQTSILGVLPWQQAQDSPFIVSAFVEKLYGSGAARFATAMVLWIAFASVFLRCSDIPASHTPRARWKFLPRFRPRASTEEVPARLAPLSRTLTFSSRYSSG